MGLQIRNSEEGLGMKTGPAQRKKSMKKADVRAEMENTVGRLRLMRGPKGMFTARGMAHFETDKMGDAEKREHKILGM